MLLSLDHLALLLGCALHWENYALVLLLGSLVVRVSNRLLLVNSVVWLVSNI